MFSESLDFSGFDGGAILSTSRITRLPKIASIASWSDFETMDFGTVRFRFLVG